MPNFSIMFVLLFLIAAPSTWAEAAGEDNDARNQSRAKQFDEQKAAEQSKLSADRNFFYYLSQLNMTAEFTLTAEQKAKIAALREAFWADQKAFKEEKKQELAEIQKRSEAARKKRDYDAVRKAYADQRALLRQGPSHASLNDKVMAELTDAQRAAAEAKMAEVVAQNIERMKRSHDRRRGQAPQGNTNRQPKSEPAI